MWLGLELHMCTLCMLVWVSIHMYMYIHTCIIIHMDIHVHINNGMVLLSQLGLL